MTDRTARDETFMRAALAEAAKGLGRTSPNPAVGCVVVKGGRIVARGHHRRAGLPHAEVEALSKLKGKAAGATVYVNLEPCCHTGRTGPCTEALIAARVKEVVLGMRDPNPLVNGKGIRALEKAGVKVRLGVLEHEARALNEAFVRWVSDGRPHVTLKAAVSLDGRIAPAGAPHGAPAWVTGEAARVEAHRMRDRVDAVLVGIGTVLADDPRLTTRVPRGRTARRVVLDSDARTPLAAKVLDAVPDAPTTTIFVADDADAARVRALESEGAVVIAVPRSPRGLDLAAVLAGLAKLGVTSLLVEGGADVFTSFLAARLVDRVRVFVAPSVLGAQATPFVHFLPEPLRLAEVSLTPFGSDVMVDGVPAWAVPASASRGHRKKAG